MVAGVCDGRSTQIPFPGNDHETSCGIKNRVRRYSKDNAKLAGVRHRIGERLATPFLAHTSQGKAE